MDKGGQRWTNVTVVKCNGGQMNGAQMNGGQMLRPTKETTTTGKELVKIKRNVRFIQKRYEPQRLVEKEDNQQERKLDESDPKEVQKEEQAPRNSAKRLKTDSK